MKPITGWAALVTPLMGVETTSRTELMMVMTPTYRSPPKACRVELQATWTMELVMAMTKLEKPRETIFHTSRAFSRR